MISTKFNVNADNYSDTLTFWKPQKLHFGNYQCDTQKSVLLHWFLKTPKIFIFPKVNVTCQILFLTLISEKPSDLYVQCVSSESCLQHWLFGILMIRIFSKINATFHIPLSALTFWDFINSYPVKDQCERFKSCSWHWLLEKSTFWHLEEARLLYLRMS